MAVKSKEDILNDIKERFKDDTSDSTLSFLEDVADTIIDYEKRAEDSTDWKTKYEENDKEWREKYKERFFSPPVETQTVLDNPEPELPKVMSYEDLFKTE